MALPPGYKINVIRDQFGKTTGYMLIGPHGQVEVPSMAAGEQVALDEDRRDRISRFGEEAVLKAEREEKDRKARAQAEESYIRSSLRFR